MSLKDEIEKLIQAEQQKLDIQGQEDKERLRRAEKRFRPLAALLKEVASSVEKEFLETIILAGNAIVKVGKRENELFYDSIAWEVYPEPAVFGHQVNGGLGWILKEENGKASFIVNETTYYLEGMNQKSFTFETEQEVIEYFIKKISKEVAHQRRLKKL